MPIEPPGDFHTRVMQRVQQEAREPEAMPSMISTVANALQVALLSLVLPGFGQLYVGDANRALGIFLAFALLGIPVVIIVSLYLPIELTAVSVALATLASIGVWVYAVLDAWRQAKRCDPFVPAAWQTRTVYTSVFLLTTFVLLPAVIGYVRQHLVQPFYIPNGSMSPRLLSGDLLFADMSYNCPNCFKAVKRGDVAIFVYPDNRAQYFVKRIVALPGDTIEIVDGEMIINGTPSTFKIIGLDEQLDWVLSNGWRLRKAQKLCKHTLHN